MNVSISQELGKNERENTRRNTMFNLIIPIKGQIYINSKNTEGVSKENI